MSELLSATKLIEDYLYHNKPKKALRLADELIEKDSSNTALQLLKTEILFRQDKREALRQNLSYLTHQFPSDAKVLKTVAQYYVKTFEFPKAIHTYQLLKAKNLLDSQSYFNYVNLLIKFFDWESVDQEIEHFIALYPDDVRSDRLSINRKTGSLSNLHSIIEIAEKHESGEEKINEHLYLFLVNRLQHFYAIKKLCESKFNPDRTSAFWKSQFFWQSQYLIVLVRLNENEALQEELFKNIMQVNFGGKNGVLKTIASLNPKYRTQISSKNSDLISEKENIELFYADNPIAKKESLSNQEDKKIDLVYTWVDMSDPVFTKLFEKENGYNPNTSTNTQQNHLRYESSKEIMLSLLSIQHFFLEVNNIYIVTKNQKFNLSFLNEDFQKKIHFIDHDTIFDKEFAPHNAYFNSNVIESFLWRIPNLSEHFLYFNDDNFLSNHLIPEQFLYDESGKFYTYFTLHPTERYNYIDTIISEQNDKIYPDAFRNNARKHYISHFGKEPNLICDHIGFLLNKSVCEYVFNQFKEEWRDTLYANKLRTNESVHSLLLYSWFAVTLGIQKPIGDTIVKQNSLLLHLGISDEHVQYIFDKRPTFCCVNNLLTPNSHKNLQQLIDRFQGVKN